MFAVIVKYGTLPNQIYAGAIPTREAANILLEKAVERGYKDARVVREKDFFEERQAYNASRASAAAAA